ISKWSGNSSIWTSAARESEIPNAGSSPSGITTNGTAPERTDHDEDRAARSDHERNALSRRDAHEKTLRPQLRGRERLDRGDRTAARGGTRRDVAGGRAHGTFRRRALSAHALSRRGASAGFAHRSLRIRRGGAPAYDPCRRRPQQENRNGRARLGASSPRPLRFS